MSVRLAIILTSCAISALAQQSDPAAPPRFAPPERPEWNRPAEPFRVVGNIYYVGAANVSSFLITTEQGHILLETGFRETVPLIQASVEKLGFRFQDIRLLLASHAHYDHAGGLADVKSATGARFLSSPVEEAAFLRGGGGDFAFGDKYLFPPVKPDAMLHDGEEIRLGGVTLTAHFTPGHTKGCTSFTTQVRAGPRSYDVVFPCSLTAPGYQLVGNPKYPDIVQDFERTIKKLRALPCDVFYVHHRSVLTLREPFAGREGFHRYLDEAETALRNQLNSGATFRLPPGFRPSLPRLLAFVVNSSAQPAPGRVPSEHD